MADWLKKNWLLILGILVVIYLIYTFSFKVGGAVAGLLSFFKFGGKGAVRKVRKRAKKKADSVGPHPEPALDATERMEQRRKARGEN